MFKRICLFLLFSGATAVQYLNHIWERRFLQVSVVETAVGQLLRVQSVLDAPPDVVWTAVQKPAMLSYIAYPLLTFTPTQADVPITWQQGEAVNLQLRGLGLIPLGAHTIHMVSRDEATRQIFTAEKGTIARVWNHRICVEPFGHNQTRYTDEVEIEAGILGTAVITFAKIFFKYRQTRWQTIAPLLSDSSVEFGGTIL